MIKFHPELWLRFLRLRWWQLSNSVDHEQVIATVDADGSLRSSYLFMCVMSAGISITGLLINSPAVIIGAMLISPLMSPIVRLGLGVATLDYVRVRRALGVLTIGMFFALLTALMIAWLSPIMDMTPEIAARTRPNLFDLVIAILSGLAGGYAMVTRRGGAIVGVAIATALMPPMAVVGYGMASGQWLVSKGALLLFSTNLVAIALSVTAITTWYGFSLSEFRKAIVWQTGLVFLLVLPLAYPLWQSLGAITRETQIAHAVRQAVADTFGANQSRVISLQVSTDRATHANRVDLALASRHYTREDDARLREAIQIAVQLPIVLRLSPILEADPQHVTLSDSSLSNPIAAIKPVGPKRAPATTNDDPVSALLANFPLPLAAKQVDAKAKRVVLYLASTETSLKASRSLEQSLSQRLPDWTVRVVPPMQGLPEVRFGRGSSAIDADAEQTIGLIKWALAEWGVQSVRVYGYASSDGKGNARLARHRADVVAQRLTAVNIDAETEVAYSPDQSRGELRDGRSAFWIAVVTPNSVAPSAQAPAVEPPPTVAPSAAQSTTAEPKSQSANPSR
ncbi:MAG: DUF389 domain-containing protein [Lysobacteraceae bacterium]